MRQNSPSLTAVRAFEAAARHESISRAAEELQVTSGAISQQISQLEARLGQKLFTKVRQRLFLTDAGRSYLQPLSEALDSIETATVDLLTQGGPSENLRIACLPTLADRWLIPKLVIFGHDHPETRVTIETNIHDLMDDDGLPALHPGGPDLCLMRGSGPWQGLEAHKLMEETLVPAASPSLVLKHLTTAEEIGDYPLLHHTKRPECWLEWMETAGAELDLTTGHAFDHFHLLIEAAVAGLGIALLPRTLIEREIAFGQLIQVSDASPQPGHPYCLVHSPHVRNKAPLIRFRDWLTGYVRRQ